MTPLRAIFHIGISLSEFAQFLFLHSCCFHSMKRTLPCTIQTNFNPYSFHIEIPFKPKTNSWPLQTQVKLRFNFQQRDTSLASSFPWLPITLKCNPHSVCSKIYRLWHYSLSLFILSLISKKNLVNIQVD